MKITSVTPVPVSAGTAFGARNSTFVKVETDEGITGWGEANPWREDAAVWRAGDGYIASMQDTNWS